MFRPLSIRDLAILSGSVASLALVTALLRALPDISSATVALIFLLIVLASATLARLHVAIAVSLIAMFALNFFFLPPLGTLTIANPQNWIALFVFLLVAVIASNLSAAAQKRASEAIARRNEVTRLFDLTRDVLLTSETTSAIEALARHVARRFDLSRVAVCLPAESGWTIHQGTAQEIVIDENLLNTVLAKARGTLEFDAHQRTYGGHVQVGTGNDAITVVPLRHGTRAVGLLAAAAPALDVGTIDALGGVVAIAIERVQFLRERDAAELVRQKADLAAALLASLSHDLKTPLTSVRLAVENLRTNLQPAERVTQADLAASELARLTRLFQDILDMARIDAAAMPIDRQWVTPADIVDAAMAHARHSLDGREVMVTADADVELEIDPRIASNALSHLLENAAQYSPRDRKVFVEARAEQDELHMTVTDEGPGLDRHELEHLFERFYRGGAGRTSPGTGMGLAITRGLLAAAGGRVWGENVEGAGAKFSIVIPGRSRPLVAER